jgi:hypothetical protein
MEVAMGVMKWRRLGSARLGSARLGSARLGSARLGSARLGSAVVAVSALFFSEGHAGASDQFRGYAAESFEGEDDCVIGGEPSDDLTYTIDQVAAADDVFDGWQASSWWDTSGFATNSSFEADMWTDVDMESWGDDHSSVNGADYIDVGYISSHGGWSNPNGSNNAISYHMTGAAQVYPINVCTPDTGLAGEVRLGDGDGGADHYMKIAIWDTCQSLQKEAFNDAGYQAIDDTDDFRMFAGYHGLSYDAASQVTAAEDYFSTSRTSGAGDHWLDERFIWNLFDVNEQCPTVMIWGDNGTERDDWFDYAGLDDWLSIGHGTGQFYYLTGCTPAGGSAL